MSFKRITIGVAGHIDHGKTALVRALTGMETDRLAEEQARGMSIVLGFAHLGVPEGEIDLVDVPGHEKFVHTMIAGATGIEAVLLVVAANERIMPQTREHMALAGLLGIEKGMVVITKSDLIPPDERAGVERDVQLFVAETFLQNAPLLWASAVSGKGVGDVRHCLRMLLESANAVPELPYFFLPIDRAFSMTGYGTVVTGTLRRGTLQVGQGVQIVPGEARAEVRSLEVHGLPVKSAPAGGRTAVNLRGTKREDIGRGNALVTPETFLPTRLLDARVRILPTASHALRQGQTVRLHYGTSEVSARAHLLDGDELLPGSSGFVQWRLKEDVVVPVQEPYVIRAVSPVETIGGGLIVDASPAKHRRFDESVIKRLAMLAEGTPAARVDAKLAEAGAAGSDIRRLSVLLCLTTQDVERALASLPVVAYSSGVLHQNAFQDVCERIQHHVQEFHGSHPTLLGMPREELRRKLPPALKPPALARALEELARQNTIIAEDGLVRLSGWTAGAGLLPKERAIVHSIEMRFRDAMLQPPALNDVLGQDKRWKTLYYYLVQQGTLIEAVDRTNNRTIVFHRDALAEAERLLRTGLANGAGMTVSQLNTVLGISRKFSIPLLEYFDARGITRRVNNLRVWNAVVSK